MQYDLALKLHGVEELLIKLDQTDLVQDFIFLFHKKYQQSLPILRDQGAHSPAQLLQLAHRCRDELGWDWVRDHYDDYAITTVLHKDLEQYLSQGFRSVAHEHDQLLHDLHICLHSCSKQNRRSSFQIEWFTDDGFSMNGYDFEFKHDRTLGAVYLINPYVGHPPYWMWIQDDHQDVWQTCRFHDFVKPGFAISMSGYRQPTVTSMLDEKNYLAWWQRHAPDFVEYHGIDKILKSAGKPVIGYVINNTVLDCLDGRSLTLEYIRFNDQLEIKPARLIDHTRLIDYHDYQKISGPDWPSYEDFCASTDHADWLKHEIKIMTGLSL